MRAGGVSWRVRAGVAELVMVGCQLRYIVDVYAAGGWKGIFESQFSR
jgi:hypothetical protein